MYQEERVLFWFLFRIFFLAYLHFSLECEITFPSYFGFQQILSFCMSFLLHFAIVLRKYSSQTSKICKSFANIESMVLKVKSESDVTYSQVW